jgi:hypothetical protein
MGYRFRSRENDSDLMREGEYEVYLKECGPAETKGGTPCIKFDFVVRADVEQAYKNKHKFKNFFFEPDGFLSDKNQEKIEKWANALGIPKGEDFELDDLVGRSCLMVIGHYVDDKTMETKDCIYYLKSSKVESYITPAPAAQLEEAEDDGELPF